MNEVLRTPGVPLHRDAQDAHEHPVSARSIDSPDSAEEHAAEHSPLSGAHDFGAIRVHTDERAALSARAVGARAYTVGTHMVFGRGAYAPHTTAGRRLLAHELVHTLQQHDGVLRRQEADEEKAPATKPEANTEEKTTEAKGTETKSLVLSRGILQMTSEGDFTTGDTSVKRPHFPFNVDLYQKLTDEEIKAYDDAKTAHETDEKSKGKKFEKPYQRYSTPDTNGILKEDDNGAYKRIGSKSRHATETYTTTLPEGQQLGTMNGSGVTIGFGVDLGNRYKEKAAAEKDLKAAGILDEKGNGVGSNKAEKLLDAVGLIGVKAAEKAATLRSEGVELTSDQALKLLDTIIPSYDKAAYPAGYARGDGTVDPAIEEVVMALAYWGAPLKVRKAILEDAKGKKGAEQFTAAAAAITRTKSKVEWMQRGYQLYITYLEMLAEAKTSGYEITMSGSVSSAETLTGTATKASDDTLQFVSDLSERAGKYKSAGKDLKKQIAGTSLPKLISGNVGEGTEPKNAETDVRVVQQLLYNGNYDVEVTGVYDAKTQAAIEKFTKDELGTTKKTIEPDKEAARRLKKFKYVTRTPAATTPATGK